MRRVFILLCYASAATYTFGLFKGQFVFKGLVNEQLVLSKQNGAALSTAEHLRWNELYSIIPHHGDSYRVSWVPLAPFPLIVKMGMLMMGVAFHSVSVVSHHSVSLRSAIHHCIHMGC